MDKNEDAKRQVGETSKNNAEEIKDIKEKTENAYEVKEIKEEIIEIAEKKMKIHTVKMTRTTQ